MIDELKDGVMTYVQLFQDEYARIFYLLLVSGVILGVFLAASVIPNYLGIGPKNPDFAYCATSPLLSPTFVLTPLITYLGNPPLGQAQMGCPVLNANYGLIVLFFIEMTVITVILSLIAVIVAHAFGVI